MKLSMKTHEDFIINDAACKTALMELITTDSVLGWITKYSGLYRRVTIKPKGLPRIARSNMGGFYFENISKLNKEYSRLFKIDNSITMN